MPNKYDRKPQIYTVQEILSQRLSPDVFRRDAKKDFDGDMINMNSLRYECFDIKGTKCAFCGIEGTRFYKERIRANEPYHFNLYAVNEDGIEVIMTKDHIYPTARGGENNIDNLQTACYRCNFAKKDIPDQKVGRMK